MCGIVAILRRPILRGQSHRQPPAPSEILRGLDAAQAVLERGLPTLDIGGLDETAAYLEAVDSLLRGPAGVSALLANPSLAADVEGHCKAVEASVTEIETALDAGRVRLGPESLEAVNASLVRLKDAAWALRQDRLRAAREVDLLAGPGSSASAIEGYWSIQCALSAIDRLEVRGRDSAGLHLLVEGHQLDLAAPEVSAALGGRMADPLLTSMALRAPRGHLVFVYKAAAEIGELGDNTRALRASVSSDPLLRRALQADTARVTVLGHTRWASVGIISEANAHPLNHEEEGVTSDAYVAAALNGDVDNYAELIASEGLRIPAEITTDAKVIPAMMSHRLDRGMSPEEAFRSTVSAFEGSVAIAATAADAPGRLLLALRGSGQALYVGLAEDAFVVTSEPYGLVEETTQYLRLDGESSPAGIAGQVIALDSAGAGTLEGIVRTDYAGQPLPPAPSEVQTAEITSRDIDRAGFPHFLLKEIFEAPQSFRKTLRGKITEADGQLRAELGEETLPDGLRQRLAAGQVRNIKVIGQGTAAVAGQSMAVALTDAFVGSGVSVEALPATELSGFRLKDDMSDCLVVAISQSGTTTDTNRTVDLVRARGAAVVAIVNRRNSDLVERSDGVLYTSDGRDVEMSVASTKAFYAQVAAGYLLAVAIASEMGRAGRGWSHELLEAMRELPVAMEAVLARRDSIASAAQRHAPSRRHWAVVGNGPNCIAARELRIKLSELCYKSIACDATEDKKHIDLSSEPLVLVCAAGLTRANADDVAKEIAIYRAHKAAPIVIATEAEGRFPAAVDLIEVPGAHPALAFVLSAMAGHLFAYEAALAIDAQALPFREARSAVEALLSSEALVSPEAVVPPPHHDGSDPLQRLTPLIEPAAQKFLSELRSGSYDGHLEASTAVRVASLFRYALGTATLESYQVEFGKLGTPSVVIEDLTDGLTRAIEELTRPIDAIKHQAKTVTVGISRSEEALFRVPLVKEVLAAGPGRDRISYRALRTLAALDSAIQEVIGFTRYRVEGGGDDGSRTIHVVDRGGVARQIPSRTEQNPALRGTKHRAATAREVTVARGGNDGRTVVLVPETKDNDVTGITLLHVRFRESLTAKEAKDVLLGYWDRYAALVDAVTETEPAFDEEVLSRVPIVELLVEPVHVLARHWRVK